MTNQINTYNLPNELVEHFTKHINYFGKLLSKDFSKPNTLVTQDDLKKIEISFNNSHRIREFEINLYWQRLNYLWAVIALLFAGWGTLAIKIVETAGKNTSLTLYISLSIISLIGCVVTIFTSFIVKAGKHWQKVWEYHIYALEPFVSGSLYTMKFKIDDVKYKKPSISKTVEVFNWCLLLLWVLSTILSAIIPIQINNSLAAWLQVSLSILILVLFFIIKNKVTQEDKNNILLENDITE